MSVFVWRCNPSVTFIQCQIYFHANVTPCTLLIAGSSVKSDSKTSTHSASSTKSHSDSTIPAHGLPLPLIAEQLVSLSGDRKLLIHSYLLEFSGSLSTLASLPRAIQWTLSEVVSFFYPFLPHFRSRRETAPSLRSLVLAFLWYTCTYIECAEIDRWSLGMLHT